MKKIIVILTIFCGNLVFAGAQSDIPVELMDLDNQGRAIFIKNSLENIGVPTGSYDKLRTIIIGGENTVNDLEKGAYMGYFVRISTEKGVYNCEERMVLGVFVKTMPHLVGLHPIRCQATK